MKKSEFSIRMKRYEEVTDIKVVPNMPVILRFDGCHFHSLTKKFDKPFDAVFRQTMVDTTYELCKAIQCTAFAYTQSDEISIVLVDYENVETMQWFGGRVSKMISVGASMASRFFNEAFIKNVNAALEGGEIDTEKLEVYKKQFNKADFDCRAYNVPKEEVCNYILWRQRDAERNSIHMLASTMFTHNELKGIKNNRVQDMMFTQKGVNWNELPTAYKRGVAIHKVDDEWVIDTDMPIISKDRAYVNKHVMF